jgi:hypothetical protein
VSDIVTVAALVAGLAAIIAVIAWIGAGSNGWLAETFRSRPASGLPRGVQEADLPRLDFHDHAATDATWVPAGTAIARALVMRA